MKLKENLRLMAIDPFFNKKINDSKKGLKNETTSSFLREIEVQNDLNNEKETLKLLAKRLDLLQESIFSKDSIYNAIETKLDSEMRTIDDKEGDLSIYFETIQNYEVKIEEYLRKAEIEKNKLDAILDKTRIMDKLIQDNHYLTNELDSYRKMDNQRNTLKKEINVKNCLTKISQSLEERKRNIEMELKDKIMKKNNFELDFERSEQSSHMQTQKLMITEDQLNNCKQENDNLIRENYKLKQKVDSQNLIISELKKTLEIYEIKNKTNGSSLLKSSMSNLKI